MKPYGYWDKGKILKEAKKYKKRIDFYKGSPSAYQKACKLNLLKECYSHMDSQYKRRNYWSKERVLEVAKNYSTKKALKKDFPSVYIIARKNGWSEEAFSHMKTIGHKYKRMIYAIEFSSNNVYIGLTCDIDRRMIEHKKNPRLKIFFKDKFKVKIKGIFSIKEAGKKENLIIEEYKNKKWNILNVAKAGSLGGNFVKWNKKDVLKIAKKYKDRTSFQKGNSGAYKFAKKHKFLDQCFKHMNIIKRENNYWTENKIIKCAKNCNSNREFRVTYSGAYAAAKRLDIFNKVIKYIRRG